MSRYVLINGAGPWSRDVHCFHNGADDVRGRDSSGLVFVIRELMLCLNPWKRSSDDMANKQGNNLIYSDVQTTAVKLWCNSKKALISFIVLYIFIDVLIQIHMQTQVHCFLTPDACVIWLRQLRVALSFRSECCIKPRTRGTLQHDKLNTFKRKGTLFA